MLSVLLGQVPHTPKRKSLSQTTCSLNTRKRKQTDWECQKSDDTALGTAIASNAHLPAAKFPLAKVSAQQLYLKRFYQSKLFFPLPLMQSLWFYLFLPLNSAEFCLLLFRCLVFWLFPFISPARVIVSFFSPRLSEDPDSSCLNYRGGRLKRPAPTSNSPESGVTWVPSANSG